MVELRPTSAEELAAALAECAGAGQTIELGGCFSKRLWGGIVADADVRVSTAALDRLLIYEPADLTVGVQAGMRWKDLRASLAERNRMLPLDPPFAENATVGGVVATNGSGPRRCRYGTARDLVIGMEMATPAGKLVESGGMVVKNVTGLDMAKPLIGSMGTLAAITRVNFRVYPKPESAATFLFAADNVEPLIALRNRIVHSQAQPGALDLLNRAAVMALDLDAGAGFLLAAEAVGSGAVVSRYRRDYEALAAEAGIDVERYEGERSAAFWSAVQELPAVWCGEGRCGLRVSTVPTRFAQAISLVEEDSLLGVRAASGVVSIGVSAEKAKEQIARLRAAGFATLLEQGPDEVKERVEAWADVGSAFEVMRRLKKAFDPKNVLNPGRYYGKL